MTTPFCRTTGGGGTPDILLLSDREKRAYFHRVRPGHPKLLAAREELDLLSCSDSGSEIILLLGPPGVGKTTLVDYFSSMIVTASLSELEADPSYIPILTYVVPSPGDRAFSWGGYYTDIGERLGALHQKNILRKRTAVEEALRRRRTYIVVIDEAINMIRHVAEKSAKGNIDVLKSLGGIPGVKFVLVGSYDLNSVTAMSGQIARRVDYVHFERYRKGVAEDERAFCTTFRQLVGKLPLEGVPELGDIADQMMLATVGCIGILKTTLMRALNRSLRNNGEWRMASLEAALLKPDQLQTILLETEHGEAELASKGSVSKASEAIDALTRTLRKMERRPN